MILYQLTEIYKIWENTIPIYDKNSQQVRSRGRSSLAWYRASTKDYN